jgi:glycosyltransferase involved in cell wall biosynthesis
MMEALQDVGNADVVLLRSHVDPEARRTLFRGVNAVLANSEHEPFGLVGLETMAAGGIACTGCSGEDYAIAGQNALVLETADPREFVGLFKRLRTNPAEASALRRSGRSTAQRYAWPQVARGVLLPRIELARAGAGPRRRSALPRAGPLPGFRPASHPSLAMPSPAGLRSVVDAIVR